MELRITVTPPMADFSRRWRRAPQIFREEMLTAMRKSVLLVENRGKANAPVKTGTGRRSITGQVQQAGASVLGIVGTNLPYMVMLHKGTKAHVIVPVNKQALYWKGARHPVRRVNHPGTRPNPFLTRALAEKRGEILAVFRMVAPRVAARLASG